MVKVYALVLAVGIVGLLVVLLGGAFATNVGRDDRDPGERFGLTGKMILGGMLGFGMGGMAAEFSPLDLGWPVALLIAVVAGAVAVAWVRYAVAQAQR